MKEIILFIIKIVFQMSNEIYLYIFEQLFVLLISVRHFFIHVIYLFLVGKKYILNK